MAKVCVHACRPKVKTSSRVQAQTFLKSSPVKLCNSSRNVRLLLSKPIKVLLVLTTHAKIWRRCVVRSSGLKSNWRNRTMPDQYSCLGDQRLCTRGKSRGINAQTQKRPRAYPRTLNASSIRLTNQSSSEPPTGTRRIAFFPSLISNSSPVFSSRSEVYAFPMRRLPLPCTTAL